MFAFFPYAVIFLLHLSSSLVVFTVFLSIVSHFSYCFHIFLLSRPPEKDLELTSHPAFFLFNPWLFCSLVSLLFLTLYHFHFPLTAAFGRELQSQLLFLELFKAHHDGILVFTGLSFNGYQSHTHQLFLHTSHKLCGADGPCGSQGMLWFSHKNKDGWDHSQRFIVLAVFGKNSDHILNKNEKRRKRFKPKHEGNLITSSWPQNAE